MIVDIPGFKKIEIHHLVCDYNGTIANNGKLIEGVDILINKLSEKISVYVITADTFGTVEKELQNTKCTVIKIEKNNQADQKLKLIRKLNPENTVAFGNGRNDELMLKESIIGIGILENEGIYTKNLLSADILCKSIIDAFELLTIPNKLIATLRN
ncbi:HAD family hydrolase [Lutibacter sp. B1]|uniref:HAD family hydrolase n=1 Tax=Lutibacter sp. B1 TaxID=2725996 RepID=UPI001456B52C|nr:ATPase P [Lutibacter sp. B1]NLP56801.1 ATPase P [Lutibacter sp. B1]